MFADCLVTPAITTGTVSVLWKQRWRIKWRKLTSWYNFSRLLLLLDSRAGKLGSRWRTFSQIWKYCKYLRISLYNDHPQITTSCLNPRVILIPRWQSKRWLNHPQRVVKVFSVSLSLFPALHLSALMHELAVSTYHLKRAPRRASGFEFCTGDVNGCASGSDGRIRPYDEYDFEFELSL